MCVLSIVMCVREFRGFAIRWGIFYEFGVFAWFANLPSTIYRILLRKFSNLINSRFSQFHGVQSNRLSGQLDVPFIRSIDVLIAQNADNCFARSLCCVKSDSISTLFMHLN